jgi:biotin carboxyl carrier protein
MKKNSLLLAGVMLLLACHSSQEKTTERELRPKSPVEISRIENGSIDDELILSATSVYLRRNSVTSSIPGFITRVNIRLGDHVKKGQILYQLESKERKALGQDITKVDPSLSGFGIIQIKAPASGIVTTFDKQQTGEYVLEGAPLCTISESRDLAFQVNVPFEYSAVVKPGKKCVITLPDSSRYQAIITTPLTSMNLTAQTQTLLAKPVESLFLPENLMAKVGVIKGISSNGQIVSRNCVLSDEMMKEFWVMQLINDSTAVKVPVRLGSHNSKKAEILSPKFPADARLVTNGNYGLPDTALVNIVK